MKNKILISLICLALFRMDASSQVVFSVSPGLNLNGATLGFQRSGNFIPFVGLQVFNFNAKLMESGKRFDYDINQIVSYDDEYKGHLTVIVPTLGLKMLLNQQNQVRPYAIVSISKPIITGKVTENGDEVDEFQDEIKKISLIAGELGFGAEFFFAEQFSLAGEFGVRFMHGKYKEEDEDYDVYNPMTNEYESAEFTTIYKGNINPTYSKITFNFYFTKK